VLVLRGYCPELTKTLKDADHNSCFHCIFNCLHRPRKPTVAVKCSATQGQAVRGCYGLIYRSPGHSQRASAPLTCPVGIAKRASAAWAIRVDFDGSDEWPLAVLGPLMGAPFSITARKFWKSARVLPGDVQRGDVAAAALASMNVSAAGWPMFGQGELRRIGVEALAAVPPMRTLSPACTDHDAPSRLNAMRDFGADGFAASPSSAGIEPATLPWIAVIPLGARVRPTRRANNGLPSRRILRRGELAQLAQSRPHQVPAENDYSFTGPCPTTGP
jgi:hypothetical protein